MPKNSSLNNSYTCSVLNRYAERSLTVVTVAMVGSFSRYAERSLTVITVARVGSVSRYAERSLTVITVARVGSFSRHAERSLTVITVARVGSFSFSLLFTFVPGNLRLFDLIDSSMAILTCTNLVFQNIRDAVHIQIVTNNVIFTLLVGGWVSRHVICGNMILSVF